MFVFRVGFRAQGLGDFDQRCGSNVAVVFIVYRVLTERLDSCYLRCATTISGLRCGLRCAISGL